MPHLSGSYVTTPLPHSAMGPHFPCLPFPSYGLIEALLVAFDYLYRFSPRWALAFLTTSWTVLLYSSRSAVCFHLPFCVWVVPGAVCSSVQASWHFCLTSCSLGWTVLDPGGGDPWLAISFLGPLFPLGPHPRGLFQADPWRGWSQSLLCCAYFIKHNSMQ